MTMINHILMTIMIRSAVVFQNSAPDFSGMARNLRGIMAGQGWRQPQPTEDLRKDQRLCIQNSFYLKL